RRVGSGHEGLRMIRASAPGRAGIIGNPTDGYGGTVVSTSLAQRASVRLVPSEATVVTVCGESVPIRSRADLCLTGGYTDVAKAVLTTFDTVLEGRGFHLEAETEIPMR